MNQHNALVELRVLAVDLAKQSFQVHGTDGRGRVLLTRRLSRARLRGLLERLPGCVVAMEACGGAHHWARQAQGCGHQVRLLSQYVKPYVKSNKNDARDAEAIAEAASRPGMRFVPVKSLAQQDVQSLHRVRAQAVATRTALVNQMRGLLAEYGQVLPRGRAALRRRLPELLETPDNGLTVPLRELLAELYGELVHLDERVAAYDRRIAAVCAEHPACRRLCSIRGIGPLSATAAVAAAGDGREFSSGRGRAAWLGVVPRQHSSGGKTKLLGISKRGDVYLRTLLIHGARSVIRAAANKPDRHSRWIQALVARRGKNIAAVALANKNARMLWALLRSGEDYCAERAVALGQ